MQTEEFGGEKERDGGRKGERKSQRERERSTDGRGSRYSGGVEEGNKWKWQLQYTPIENVSLSSLVHPRIFPFLSVHEIQTILPFFPLSLSLFHCIFLSQERERERERESCVYIFLISPFRPQYNSLMLLLFLSPPSLYNLHPPQSQYSVVYIVLKLNSGVITAWAVQLRCVCVGGVLAAAW